MSDLRTDIHRPSAPEFDPANYILRGVFDFKTESKRERKAHVELVAALKAQGFKFAEHRGQAHQCGHCGAHLRYAALLSYLGSELIYVGEDCLDNRFQGTKAEFDALRKAAAEQAKATRARDDFNAFLVAHPELIPATYLANVARPLIEDGLYAPNINWAANVIEDVLAKLQRYGSLSDKQIAFVAKLLAEVEEKVAARVERDAAPVVEVEETRELAPSGRVQITGEVVHFKTETRTYGWNETTVTKILVVEDRGFKVWVTLPASVNGAAKHDRITFTATLEPSNDDKYFAFASRPVKASFVNKEVA